MNHHLDQPAKAEHVSEPRQQLKLDGDRAVWREVGEEVVVLDVEGHLPQPQRFGRGLMEEVGRGRYPQRTGGGTGFCLRGARGASVKGR